MKSTFSLLIWLVCVGVALALYFLSARAPDARGITEVETIHISPLEEGRLQRVFVSTGQHVKEGDIVARMDTSILDAQYGLLGAQKKRRHQDLLLEKSRAEIQLEELQKSISGFHQSILELERSFVSDVESTEGLILKNRVAYETKKVELAQKDKEWRRYKDLLQDGVVSRHVVDRLRSERDVLRREIELLPNYAKMKKLHLSKASKRLRAVKQWLGSQKGDVHSAISNKEKFRERQLQGRIETLKETIGHHEQEMKEALNLYNLRKSNALLRAPRDGIVSEILLHPGETVGVGRPVVQLTLPGASRVIGILPEEGAHHVSEGQQVRVRRVGVGNQTPVLGKIEVIYPGIQAWGSARNPSPLPTIRGLKFIIRLEGSSDLLPGEAVEIQLRSKFWERWD